MLNYFEWLIFYMECSIINGTSCFSANPSKAVPDACTYQKPTKTVDFGLSEGLEHCY
ncbi:hypothetical protein C0J52_11706 [Blattella germanica]|nr:hypothetical protein C0J52_11706 [Blattella germanica]